MSRLVGPPHQVALTAVHAAARAQAVADAHGVPTAVPAEYEDDPGWLGAPFLVMPAVSGYVPGPMPLHDPWITESVVGARAVSETMVDLLARIHTIDWRAEQLGRSALFAAHYRENAPRALLLPKRTEKGPQP